MENIVEFKDVNKKFGKTEVIKEASFGIRKNSICGFIGPNGAGKTTIIKLILEIIQADEGEIKFAASESGRKCTIGAIVGGASYYGHLSAYNNMKVVAGMKNYNITAEKIENLLKLVGLENTGSKKVKHFSMGMKQRLSIAFSLIGNPEFLIWDEPLNGLDPEGIIEIRQIIQNIRKSENTTFLISSHILSELDKIADQIVLINHGRILYNDDFDKFLKDYSSESLEGSYMKCISEGGEGR